VGSVNLAPPVMSAVISPLSVLTVKLSVKLESNTLAPPTTWYFKTISSVGSSISDNEAKSNSINSLLKASLIGAKTVNGAGAVA